MPTLDYKIRLTATFESLPVGTDMRWDGHEYYAMRDSDKEVITCHKADLGGNYTVVTTVEL